MRCERVEIDIEPIAVGLGVHQQREPVARAQSATGGEIDPSVTDIGLAIEVHPVRPVVHHAARDAKVVEFEAIDPNVEIGQDRRVGIARKKLGRAQQRPAARHQLAHVEPAPKPVKRAPVEFGDRDVEERPPRIGKDHVVQRRAPVDIALDPADRNPQPGGRRRGGDLIGDEALPDRAVEHRERDQHERDEADDRADEPAPRPAQSRTPPRGFLALGRAFHDRVLGHQNACPSET